MKHQLLFIFSFLSSLILKLSFAQNPSLGLVFQDQDATLGYTLYTPETNNYTYLIDNCGQVVNTWTFGELPGATCYLLENGNLLRAGKDTLQIKDWDDNLIWSFALNAKLGLNQHHDIEPLPNGNILCIITDNYANQFMLSYGLDTIINPAIEIKLDKIVELKPIGTDSAEVVWEWKYLDHLVQDYDNTKLNYGVVADHPELVDINFVTPYGGDFIHLNAIDYNANLDQIMISARSLSEIMIIDHSTTTAEAASHTGGNSNKGGDILWRWGNPIVYDQGSSADQRLGIQHDCKWITDGYMDEGKITVFNNAGINLDGSFSSIHIINPTIVGGEYQKLNNRFLPESYEWTFSGVILTDTLNENKKSSTHALPNGNFMIGETSKGRISEVDRDGNLQWCFINPSGQDTIFQQDELIPNTSNRMFRGEKYPADFVGFVGKDLSQKGTIEDQNSLSDSCDLSVPTAINDLNLNQILFKNPSKNGELEFFLEQDFDLLRIVNLEGKVLQSLSNFRGNKLNLNLSAGIYLIEVEQDQARQQFKLIVE